MSIFKFTNPLTGKPFEIKGPATLTEAQARAIFEQQLNAGSLVGLKPGDVVSAATQAAAGLSSALPQLSQAVAGIAGSASGALQGALKNVPGGISGAAGALGGALNNVTGAVSGVTGAIGGLAGQAGAALTSTLQSASGLPASLSGAIDTAKSVAEKAVSGITNAISTTPAGSGIGLANFAKQATALAPIGSLSVPDVTATLGQVNKLVGQAAGALSDTLGVGKFGLDGAQLEIAGILKPGTVSKFLASGTDSLTSVLKSPTVFTGLDGIKSIDSLLARVPSQDAIQQKLMAVGKGGLDQLGIPTDKLNPAALSGALANAAKSIPDAAKWATGLPLPTDIKSAFNQTASASSFAVDFSQVKVPEEFKAQVVPPVAENTVNRETLNAAASRVTGNSKIPPVTYDKKPPKVDVVKWSDDFVAAQRTNTGLLQRLSALGKEYAKTSDKSELLSIQTRLETLKQDATEAEGVLIGLENQAKVIKRELGSFSFQSDLDLQKEVLQTIFKAIDSVLAKVKAELAKTEA